MRPAFVILTLALASAGCATTNTSTTSAPELASKGEIVLSETAPAVNRTAANVAVNVGSAVLGALVPGPWGSVAGVAAGSVGGAAVQHSGTVMRYHVRLEDGTVQTINQTDAPALDAGTPVDILTLANGTKRVVPVESAAPDVVAE